MEDYQKNEGLRIKKRMGYPLKEEKILLPEKMKEKHLAILINEIHFVE